MSCQGCTNALLLNFEYLGELCDCVLSCQVFEYHNLFSFVRLIKLHYFIARFVSCLHLFFLFNLIRYTVKMKFFVVVVYMCVCSTTKPTE